MNQNQVVSNTIVMNNYINVGNPNIQQGGQIPNPGQNGVFIDDLMSYFSTKYKNILPNRLNMEYDFKAMLFPFEKTQVVELIYQMDILVQLLIQNFLFSSNEDTKFKSYELLMKIYNTKHFKTSMLEHMPTYQIYLSKFKLESNQNNLQDSAKSNYNNKWSVYCDMKPQMSILQSPLLEFKDVFLEIRSKLHSKERTKETLLYLEPFIQKNWVPVFSDQNSSQGSARMKFNHIDDCILLIGLTKYGAKKLDLIQKNFLPGKTVAEIKNRYKNLICGRANDNKIKRWKILQFAPLRDEEKLKLQKAVEWFGSADKYELFSRYFLPERSPEFLKAELTKSDSLVKKRKKYANLLSSNTFSDSPQPSYDFQIERDSVERQNGHISYQPQSIRSMEVEEADNSPGAPNNKFEEIILALSDNNAKMPVENKPMLVRQKSEENFEAEELDSSQISSDDEVTLPFSGINGIGKRFKKIGSEIFEFEEV